MVAGLLITAIAGFIFWLVFFKFNWIRLTYGWGLFLIVFILHLMLNFLFDFNYFRKGEKNVQEDFYVDRNRHFVLRLR